MAKPGTKRRRLTGDEKRKGLRAWVEACRRGQADPKDADFDDVEFLIGQIPGPS